ncbi:MAG TPA: sugar phosphate isomerase/epimerase family protein [Candidatus Binatia bacterium]
MDLLPFGLPYPVQFQIAAEAGFEAVEMEAVGPGEAEAVRAAAIGAGLKIHSVLTYDNWRYPLSSKDPDEVEKGVQAVREALANARLWGADTLLLVPAVVDAQTSYQDAYRRSQAVIRRELLPLAEEMGIVLGIENVWNGFLLSPLEYARYIDELESPWARAYLDVGNMMFGHPEHWIGACAGRIVKLHIKDFRLDVRRGRFFFGKIGEGAVDWSAVRAALLDAGFSGYITSTGVPHPGRLFRWIGRAAKLCGGRRAWSAARRRADVQLLRDVSRRFDAFRDGCFV